ncbi:MAG TPA: type I restriction endonuclease subunit R, partial [Candidatus Limnocylindrales bacterium]
APGERWAERGSYEEVVLAGRLSDAIERLNPTAAVSAREDALRRVLRPAAPNAIDRNRRFHRLLVDGIEVEYAAREGRVAGERIRLIDLDRPGANDWLAVNQFTVIEGGENRRPDVVLFVNGLPLVLMELKDPTTEGADIWSAFNQLQTYKSKIPGIFDYNELLIASNAVEARFGSLTSGREWFMRWRTIDGVELAPMVLPELEVLIRGLLSPQRLLEYLRHFVVYEDELSGTAKKLAGYHQFHAVNRAVEATVAASRPAGDRRAGVVWHTQGSGKSLTMAFFSGRLVLEPALENPTIVVLTDRNDLDDQLFGTFTRCAELLRQRPVQAGSATHLKRLLSVASGGVVFTTIQKFLPDEGGVRFPRLTDRRNVVVIADEAHRSQYDFIDGFARNIRDALPNATFIGFTGTPIELADRSTPAVFGDYIDIYDITRAVDDGATVPIYYESRLAKLALPEDEKPRVDAEFQEVTEGEEDAIKEKIKSKWAALEALVGTEKRLSIVAADLVEHLDHRTEALEGKAMIVCMSRRIAAELYTELIRLRPEWHGATDDAGALKVMMTGSASDQLVLQPHIRNKGRREALARRFRDPDDPFRVVIVRDMWLTGFDAPSLHTMYLDKPMRGHGLMQAIARVNRVFRDKPGGLVVDYLGLADQLRQALANYTASGGTGRTAIDQAEAVAAFKERYEVVAALFYGFDRTKFFHGTSTERVSVLPAALEHVLAQEDGRERLLANVSALSKAFALAVPHEDVLALRDEVAFFQAVRAALPKGPAEGSRGPAEIEHAVRQIVAGAIVTDQVIDVFAAAGLPKPDISILSEEFLAEVRELPQKNLAVELLRKLLTDEIKTRSRRNLVESRAFSEMLEKSLRKYQNRAIETAAIIEELIDLAKTIREAKERGEKLGLSDDELAFYDALETNDSAVAVLGDDTLRTIARELVGTVRRNTTIDWAEKESVRAKLRLLVKRTLRKYGYPPDHQEQATRTVLEQAEVLSASWGIEPPEEASGPGESYPLAGSTQAAIAAERPTPLDA